MKERGRGSSRSEGTGTGWVVCMYSAKCRELHALSEMEMYKVMYRLWEFDMGVAYAHRGMDG